MNIVVFSDSHRDIEPMEDLVERLKPDMVIHLGDHIYDAAELKVRFADIPMESVKGNCDLGSNASSYKLINAAGTKIFLTHGDVFGVRTGTSELASKGRELGADLILFGHTHRPVVKKKKGIPMMNPGSIGRRTRGIWAPSFGVVKTTDKLEYFTLDYDFVMSDNTFVPW